MAALGALGIGLSIAFGGFVLVLLAELYYVFFWKRYKRVNNVATEYNTERCSFAHEAALVGSFGGYSGCAMDAEFLAKLFPVGSDHQPMANDNLYMHGVFGDPRLLFTIKEETKEDLEFEETAKVKAKANAAKDNNSKARASPTLPSSELQPSPKQQQQQQQQQAQLMHFSYSIGLIQQPVFPRSISQRASSESPSPRKSKNYLQSSSDSSPIHDSSCSSSPAHYHRPSASSSRRNSSACISPCSGSSSGSPGACSPDQETTSALDSPRQCELLCREPTRYSSASPQGTPFGTPISSPSLLTPPGTPPFTPPLTPIKAATVDDASARALARKPRTRTSITSSSAEDSINASFSSSKCSSPSSDSFHRNPSVDSGRVPTTPLENPFESSPQKRTKSLSPTLPCYINAQSERHPALMERRAFVSLFKEPMLQTLPREPPREYPRPDSRFRFSSSNGSPCTPFATAPSTPLNTAPSEWPLRDPGAKEAALPPPTKEQPPEDHLQLRVSH